MTAELSNKFGAIPDDFENESYYDTLPQSIATRVFGLKSLQAEQHELEKQYHKEVLALEVKYNGLFESLNEKRKTIITGAVEPSEEQVSKGKKIADEEEEGAKRVGPKPDDKVIKGVPEFWLTCFKNNLALAELITDRDEEALNHLSNIRVEYLPENVGYKLVFEFSENEFFTNSEISKTFYFTFAEPNGVCMIDRAEGSTIQWKEGKNLTVSVKSRKQRHKDSKETRVITKTEPAESFFNFFNQKDHDHDHNCIDGDEDHEHDSEDQDFEIAETIKDSIVNHAVDWYTGKALEYEGLDFDQDYDDEDFEDYPSSDDENRIEEIDDDDETVTTKIEDAPECKQQ